MSEKSIAEYRDQVTRVAVRQAQWWKRNHACVRCEREIPAGVQSAICVTDTEGCERREADIRYMRAYVIAACPIRG